MSLAAPVSHDHAISRVRTRVRGAVQGVGFRPFVWTLAKSLNLSGWVLNDQDGVLLEVEGREVTSFLRRLSADAPPLARIDSVSTDRLEATGDIGFEIRLSAKTEGAKTAITPDMTTCPDCLEDIFDTANRRYHYPFTNCTHCGPRYTITKRLPYDRAETSMAPFAMCPECQAEYDNPADRRFHAQPNACSVCGPKLSMMPKDMVERLAAGEILAIKGLGGFHLVVDAKNPNAVNRLRERKQRDGKPFAVMVSGLASARCLADVSVDEADLLSLRSRPVVVLRSKPGNGLAPGVSDGLPTIGLMLPYTPVHYLLFHELAGCPTGTGWLEDICEAAFVMTSANPGGEPLVTDNEEAIRRLSGIADTIVTHDRDIVVRCDDSVMRLVAGAPAFIRRARGYVPEPIKLAKSGPSVLAVGGHLKNTVCVTRGDEAFVSQHIGDLDNLSTYDFFKETVDHLLSILDVTPEGVACDLHPEFLSTRFAEESGLPLVRVQHHHAHLAAVAAEHHIQGPVFGLALDGFGLGEDGVSSWGGERLVYEGAGFRRLGHLVPLCQPGGDKAAREPWRMGAAALYAMGRTEAIPEYFADHSGSALISSMLTKQVNAPKTSSMGRLFDAACGLLGVKPIARFEGEAPMVLEALVTCPSILPDGWAIETDGTLTLTPLLEALIGCAAEEGADLFHGTLAAALSDWVLDGLDRTGLTSDVILSGGCIQNKVLTELLVMHLSDLGITVYRPVRVPANDGGLSLGQALIALGTDFKSGEHPCV